MNEDKSEPIDKTQGRNSPIDKADDEDNRPEENNLDPEDTNANVRGRPFAKGHSGNPAGRPKGSRNQATLAAQEVFDGEVLAVSRKAIELALEGNQAALRLCLERMLPPRRERAIRIDIPSLETAGDAREAMRGLISGIADGGITLGEGRELAKLIDLYVKTLEADDLQQRLQKFERWAAEINAERRR